MKKIILSLTFCGLAIFAQAVPTNNPAPSTVSVIVNTNGALVGSSTNFFKDNSNLLAGAIAPVTSTTVNGLSNAVMLTVATNQGTSFNFVLTTNSQTLTYTFTFNTNLVAPSYVDAATLALSNYVAAVGLGATNFASNIVTTVSNMMVLNTASITALNAATNRLQLEVDTNSTAIAGLVTGTNALNNSKLNKTNDNVTGLTLSGSNTNAGTMLNGQWLIFTNSAQSLVWSNTVNSNTFVFQTNGAVVATSFSGSFGTNVPLLNAANTFTGGITNIGSSFFSNGVWSVVNTSSNTVFNSNGTPVLTISSNGDMTITGNLIKDTFRISQSSSIRFQVGNGLVVADGGYALSASAQIGNPDVFLNRDAANTLSLKNGTANQTNRIYSYVVGNTTALTNAAYLQVSSVSNNAIFIDSRIGVSNLNSQRLPIVFRTVSSNGIITTNLVLNTDGTLVFSGTTNLGNATVNSNLNVNGTLNGLDGLFTTLHTSSSLSSDSSISGATLYSSGDTLVDGTTYLADLHCAKVYTSGGVDPDYLEFNKLPRAQIKAQILADIANAPEKMGDAFDCWPANSKRREYYVPADDTFYFMDGTVSVANVVADVVGYAARREKINTAAKAEAALRRRQITNSFSSKIPALPK